MLPTSDHTHANGKGLTRNFATNTADANQAKSCARDFPYPRLDLPHGMLSPDMLLRQPYGRRNALGERKYLRDHVFGNHRPMNVPRIGENDIAGHQFRKDQLVNGCGRRMNPTKLAGEDELL